MCCCSSSGAGLVLEIAARPLDAPTPRLRLRDVSVVVDEIGPGVGVLRDGSGSKGAWPNTASPGLESSSPSPDSASPLAYPLSTSAVDVPSAGPDDLSCGRP